MSLVTFKLITIFCSHILCSWKNSVHFSLIINKKYQTSLKEFNSNYIRIRNMYSDGKMIVLSNINLKTIFHHLRVGFIYQINSMIDFETKTILVYTIVFWLVYRIQFSQSLEFINQNWNGRSEMILLLAFFNGFWILYFKEKNQKFINMKNEEITFYCFCANCLFHYSFIDV